MLRPIQLGPDLVGKALPWDVFDRHGVLLMAKGSPVIDAGMLARLRSRPLYARADELVAAGVPSPFERLHELARALGALATAPEGTAAGAEVEAIVAGIAGSVAADPDASLGWAALDREAPYSIRHAMAVAVVCELGGRQLPLDAAEQRSVVAAALTMNVSMQLLQDRLFAVREAPTDAERAEITSHPHRSAAWLQARGVLDAHWLEAVADHHERLDGSGYPQGKPGSAVGLAARLVGLADVYCATVAERLYRPPRLPATAANDILLGRRRGFDPLLAGILTRSMGGHPPGTLVRLANGEVAVVTRNPPGGAISLMAVVTADGEVHPLPAPRDPSRLATGIRSYVAFDPLRHHFDLDRVWGYRD